MQTISFFLKKLFLILVKVKFISIMSSVTYFLDLIASIKKETFISFKIQTKKLGLKLDLFRTKSR